MMKIVRHFLQAHPRRRLLYLLIMLIALYPIAAAAAEFVPGGSSVTVASPVNDDLYVYGLEISIDADIHGDLIVGGGVIYVNGDIDGSIIAAGATDIVIRGDVGGNVNAAAIRLLILGDVGGTVRAAARTVDIVGSSITGDLAVAGSEVLIDDASTIGQETALKVNSADVQGMLNGELTGSIGQLGIAGVIVGPIDVRTDQLTLQSGASVAGPVSYTSDNEIALDPDITVSDVQIKRLTPSHPSLAEIAQRSVIFAVLRFLFAAPIGILLLTILPGFSITTVENLRYRPRAALIWGVAASVGIPIGLFGIMVTVVGIPIALALGSLFAVILYASQLVVGLMVGREIAWRLWRKQPLNQMTIRSLLLGVLVVVTIRSLPIPYWTLFTSLIITVAALGATVITLYPIMRSTMRDVTAIRI